MAAKKTGAKKTASPAKKIEGTKKVTPKSSTATNTAPAKAKEHVYVVYVDSYISENEILPRGIYRTSKNIARLDSSEDQYVRKFTDGVPDKILHEIAKTLLVSIVDEKGNYRKGEDLFEKIAKTL